jgi:hypothetical protein
VRRGSRPRGLLGTRGKAGLASTIGPVLVGVIFAFGWNMAASHGTARPHPSPGLAPTVGTAVDQAADQAWASVTPTSTRSPVARKKASASTIRQTAHRRSGYSGTLIVVVPTRGEPALRFVGHVDG